MPLLLPAPPPTLWLPPKPAIIRPGELVEAAIPGFVPLASPFRRLVYLGQAVNGTGASSITLSNLDISRAPPVSFIIVAAHGNDDTARTVTGVTLAGAAMTSIVTTGSANRPAALFGRARPPGGTATIVATFSATMSRGQGLHVWAIAVASLTPFDTATDNAASSGVLSTTVNIPANGVMIAASSHYQGAASVSWVGPTLDNTVDDANGNRGTYSGASKAGLAAATGSTVSATCSGGTSNASMAVATWS